MNFTVHEASLYVHKLAKKMKSHRSVDVVLAPNMLCLQPLSLQIDRRQCKLSAQNCYWRDEGAFTGEVSARQLKGLVDYVIIGHSERRHVFGEHDKDIRAKVQAAVRHDLTPILCVGETAHERTSGETTHVLHDQVVGGLANTTAEEIEQLVIAYEPVWAIGTGKTPTPDEANQAAKEIRKQVKHLYGAEAAKNIRVLYGGSANASNAGAFLQASDVDGLLVGSASLVADEFSRIVELAYQSTRGAKS